MNEAMKNNQAQICPQCDNHCPVDLLQALLEKLANHWQARFGSDAFSRCGHSHHSHQTEKHHRNHERHGQ